MSLKVNKLNFGGSTIDNITWGKTQVMCLKWGTEIVWEKEVPKQYIRFEPKTANDFVLSTVRYAPNGYTTYMSGPSSYNKNNGYSLAKVTFFGYEIFDFYYTSYAESNYDYLMISKLGQDWTNKTSSLAYSDSSVYLHTRGYQTTTFKKGQFDNLDANTEYSFWIMYRKDSSANSNDDRGYFGIQLV